MAEYVYTRFDPKVLHFQHLEEQSASLAKSGFMWFFSFPRPENASERPKIWGHPDYSNIWVVWTSSLSKRGFYEMILESADCWQRFVDPQGDYFESDFSK